MRTHRFYLVLSTCLALFATSCVKPLEESDYQHDKSLLTKAASDEYDYDSRKSKNPYSLSNMQKALSNMPIPDGTNDNGKVGDPIYLEVVPTLTPTHYYVEFKPETKEQADSLMSDMMVEFYDHPIDNECELLLPYSPVLDLPRPGRGGVGSGNLGGLIGTTIAIQEDTIPKPLYASISVEYWREMNKFDVEYRILDELFIPDEDKGDGYTRIMEFKDNFAYMDNDKFREQLVTASEDLATSEDGGGGSFGGGSVEDGKKWTPSGTITAYDNIADAQIPVSEVKVRARRWFTSHTGYTNEKGHFECDGRFKRPANYSIVWESSKWDIRDGIIGQARYNGPKLREPWILEITSGKSLRYAAIHRALVRWYFGDNGDLTLPVHVHKEKISYRDKKGNGHTGVYYCEFGLGILPDIYIYGKNDKGDIPLAEIMGTTAHEIGHAAHFTNHMTKYIFTTERLMETWAEFCEYVIVMKEYEALGMYDKIKNKSGYWFNKQNWTSKNGLDNYTPLLIDLHDDYDQSCQNLGNDKYPEDKIHDIPIKDIESIVMKSRNFSTLKSNLKEYADTTDSCGLKYNLTKETIDKLFEYYGK